MVVLAVDIGATWLRLSPFLGQPLGKRVYRISEVGVNGVARVIAEAAREARAEAIGVATVGPLSLKEGWIRPPNLGNVKINLRDEVEALSGLRVYMQNDCVSGLIASVERGDARGLSDVVYLTFSTGIGAGVMVDGHVLLGKDGNAHEVGHIVLEYHGSARCGCGGRGHWEALCGGLNMVLRFRERTGIEVPDSRGIFELAKAGVPEAVAFVDECMRINAAGLASVINAYDPELVVLSGAVFLNNQDVFMDGIRRYLGEYVINRPPEIRASSLGEDGPLIGAGIIAERGGVLP